MFVLKMFKPYSLNSNYTTIRLVKLLYAIPGILVNQIILSGETSVGYESNFMNATIIGVFFPILLEMGIQIWLKTAFFSVW